MQKVLPTIIKVLEYSPVAIAFVLPLLFLPLTAEFFETAKIAFLVTGASILFFAWAVRTIYEKKISFIHSKLDLALPILFLVFLASTILSPTPILGFAGSYLRFSPSLIFLLALIIYYYVFSTNIKDAKTRELTLMAFIFGLAISSLLAVANFLGLTESLPIASFLRLRIFNTLGSVTTPTLLNSVALILALGYLGSEKKNPKLEVALNVALYPLTTLIVLYWQSIGFLSLFLGLGLFFILQPSVFAKIKMVLLPLSFWLVLVTTVILTPQLSNSLGLPAHPTELGLGVTDSWQIAGQILTQQPIFGAGLGHFSESFTRLKPLSFNNSPLWNVRFDRPFSEIFLIIAETGVAGLLAYLLFFSVILNLIFRAKGATTQSSSLVVAISLLILSYFLTTGNSLIGFSLFTLLALFVNGEDESGSKMAERVFISILAFKDKVVKLTGEAFDQSGKKSALNTPTQVLPYIFGGVSLVLLIVTLPLIYLGFGAEYYSRQASLAIEANDGKAAYENMLKAVGFNPYSDVYERNLAQIALGIVANLASRPTLNDNERQLVQNLIQESVNRARIASEVKGPQSVLNWEVRAQIYRNLIGVAQSADLWAIDSYARAINLDPTNPNLRILLGGIYLNLGNFDQAASSFSQAVSLKPDHANAHYNLAQALIKLNRKPEALTQYDIALNIIGSGSPDYERAKNEREALAKENLAEVKKAQEAAPVSAESPTSAEQLKVNTPATQIKKSNVTPPIDLGNPQEASPAAEQ